MSKVGIVSSDKYKDKIVEDKNLKNELIKRGIDADIVSWQSNDLDEYDLLVLRSVWGYQNDYKNFKSWLLNLEKKGISIENNASIIMNNIIKDKQFDILKKNNIDYIETYFINNKDFNKDTLSSVEEKFNVPVVVKPTISGSGENTFLLKSESSLLKLPNTLEKEILVEKLKKKLSNNDECNIMVQPYVPQIHDGEYSSIFIDGELTHTMLRFPSIFHEKKNPYYIEDVPKPILELAKKVEAIQEFKGYLYMRVDMVLINNQAKIMEVELAEPDLLTRNISDLKKQNDVIKIFAKKIENRIR